MKADKTMRRLRWASFLALVGVVLIVWSVFDPTPIPIIVTMSVGQVIGTLSFGLYLLVVLPELRKTIEQPETTALGEEAESTLISSGGPKP